MDVTMMKGRNSWGKYGQIGGERNKGHQHANTESSNDKNVEGPVISMNSILSDDLLECILASLPIASIFRASSVCKRWNEMVKSSNFPRSSSPTSSQIPWYFMFTSSDSTSGYAFDPTLRKWYSIELPCIERSNWLVASSNGLVAFMDNDSRSKLNICNPITRRCRKLDHPPGTESSDYCSLALSVASTTRSPNYTASVIKSKQVQGNFFQWDLSIHLYDSCTTTWINSSTETVTGWRGCNESVICDATLYFLIYVMGGGGGGSIPRSRHGIVAYNLTEGSSLGRRLDESMLPVPCPLTCGRLMNLKERLVLVGGIGREGRGDMIIKGVGIWMLVNVKEGWKEITRMPNKLFQGFDEVFASGGTEDVVYIHSYGSSSLMMFDMKKEQWKLSPKCPVTKKFPLQLFNGFCFHPRLGISP